MRPLALLAASVVMVGAFSGGLGGCHMGLLGLVAGASNANGAYENGTLTTNLPPGSVRTLGCLDVGIGLLERDQDALLDVYVGNHCIRPVPLDLQRLAVSGISKKKDEETRTLGLGDPRNELVRVHVGGSEIGHERIQIASLVAYDRVCVSVKEIAPEAKETLPAPLCFRRGSERWEPV